MKIEMFTIRFSKLALFALWTAMGLVMWQPQAAAGDETAISLDDGCRTLAQRVLAVIEGEGGEKSVTLGSFSGVPRLESSGGVGLAHRIRAALEAEGIAARRGAAFQLSGEFRDSLEKMPTLQADMVALRVEYRVRAADDRVLAQGVVNFFGDAPLEIAGTTVDLGRQPETRADAAAIQRTLSETFRGPRATVVGDETRPGPASDFGLALRVIGREGISAARIPQIRDGRSFVQLEHGDEYAVRLHNRSANEVLASLTIDGLDVFTFSEDRNRQGRKVHFVIPPRCHMDVPGWYITSRRSLAFKITGYAESEAARLLGETESIGQVTAAFYHSVVRPEMAERLGTGTGRDIETDYRTLRRDEGSPLAAVTVRYEKKAP